MQPEEHEAATRDLMLRHQAAKLAFDGSLDVFKSRALTGPVSVFERSREKLMTTFESWLDTIVEHSRLERIAHGFDPTLDHTTSCGPENIDDIESGLEDL